MLGAFLTDPLLVSPPAPPGPVPGPPPPTPAGLSALGFLVGGTWVAQVTLGPAKLTLEESCRWDLDGAFIATLATRSGQGPQLHAQGYFGWDPVGSRLLSWSFESNGSEVSGQGAPAPGPDTWVFLTTVGGPTPAQGRTTLHHAAPDELTIFYERLSNGVYIPVITAHYLRRA